MKSESKRRPRNKGKEEYSLTSTRDLPEVLGEIGVPAISTGVTGRIKIKALLPSRRPMLGVLVPLFLGGQHGAILDLCGEFEMKWFRGLGFPNGMLFIG